MPHLLSFLAILFLFAAPFALSAVDTPPPPNPLVPCDGSAQNPCDFPALMQLVKNLIDFAILLLMPLAAILFAYAGWLYLSAAGNSGQVSKAHGIFQTVFYGVVITLSAWFIVKFISDALLNPDYIGLPNQ